MSNIRNNLRVQLPQQSEELHSNFERVHAGIQWQGGRQVLTLQILPCKIMRN